MSEQKKQEEGQSFSQENSQELGEQALEVVTGGVIEKPTPIGPNIYLYNSRSGANQGTVTLHTGDISIPEHTQMMGRMRPNTEWLHVPQRQANGSINHAYIKISAPSEGR
jgi:hypothetical protein